VWSIPSRLINQTNVQATNKPKKTMGKERIDIAVLADATGPLNMVEHAMGSESALV